MKNNVNLSLIIFFIFSLLGCNKPTDVLIVLGGHSFDTTDFYDVFRSMSSIRIDTTYYPGAKEILSSEKIDSYDVLVFYDYVPDMPMEDSSIFLNLTRQGKSMLFLHHALCSFQQWDGYMQLIGGRYVMPGFSADSALLSDYQHDLELEVEVVRNDHPVTLGLEDFTIHDEGYSNLTILEGITPLLTTSHPDCASTVGWVNSYNGSVTAYLIFGHDKYAYEDESFRRLLNNTLHWLAEQD